MSSRKADSRARCRDTRDRLPPSRSRPPERFSGSKRPELERLSSPEKRQQYKKSNREDNDGEICMRKLSEFNESLRGQGQATSKKFQWSHLLPDNFGEVAATKPKFAMQNERTASAYSLNHMGIGFTQVNQLIDSKPPHLKEMKLVSIQNGEDLRYPDVGSRGVVHGAVGFGGCGENFGFGSSYRKMETLKARASAIDSIIEKIDGAGENKALELDRRSSLSQQYMIEEKRELLHGEGHRQREDCSSHAFIKRYVGFSGEGEEVGFRMSNAQSPKGLLLPGGRKHLGESSCGSVLPPSYPDLLERSSRNENEQENEVLSYWMDHAQILNGTVCFGETQHFQHSIDSSVKSHETGEAKEIPDSWINHSQIQKGVVFLGDNQQFQRYIHSSRKSHEMEQENADFGSRMNHHRCQTKAPLHGETQGLPEDYGHSFPRNYLDFGRESNVKEQNNDVSSSLMNHPQDQKRRHELSEDYGHSISQHYLDLNVESHEMEQENELLRSRVNHPHKLKGVPLHGEKQQMQEDFIHSLDVHHLGLNEESYVMEQETEVLFSTMNHPQDQKGAFFHCESQQLQRDCSLESCPLPMHDDDDDECTTEGSTQQASATEEVGILSRKTHPGKRIIYLRKIRESRNNTPMRTLGALDEEILDTGYGGEQWRDEDLNQLIWLRNSRVERLQDERAVLFDELPSQRNTIDGDSPFSSHRMGEFARPSNRKNVKQRLGPPCQVHKPKPSNRISIKQRLRPHCQVHKPNPSNRISIKQRLGPPSQVHSNRKNIKHRLWPPCQAPKPKGIPRLERHKTRNLSKENANPFQEGVQARVDLPDVKRGRADPSQDSEEFKQLIHGSFVKFVKVLNENPAQRRKYTEEGEAEALRCCVCGSKSSEFVDTVSLVMHAFTSRRHRVDHLGLHKALCFFMGWNSKASSDGLWTKKTLPDAEGLAMKEDLVVWPPVVILHNSSIATTSSDARIIVNIQELEAYLRGKLKLYNGG
ncbi:hypothetical protein DITRI_Ditri05aG0053200 [Diplodiscus trichospermus]